MRQPLLSKDGSARSGCLTNFAVCGTIIGGTLALSLNIYMVNSAGYTFTGPGWAIWTMGLVVGAAAGRFVGTALEGNVGASDDPAEAQLARGAPFWGSLVLCGSCYTIYTCPFFDTEMYVFRTDYALSYNWSQEQGIVSAAEIGMLLALAAGVFVDSQGPTRCALVAAVLMILGYTAWAVTATESFTAGLALTFLCAQGSAFAYVAALSTNAVNYRSESRSLPLAACQAASSLASCTYAVCTFALASRPSKSYSAENAALRRVAMGALAAGTALALWWRSPRTDAAPDAETGSEETAPRGGLITGKPVSAPKGLATAQGPVTAAPKAPKGLMAGQGAVGAAERRKLLEYSDGGGVLSCVGAWVVFALLVGVSWAEPHGYMMLVPDSVITLYVLAWFAVVAIAICVRASGRAPYGFLTKPPPLPPSHVTSRAGGNAALAPWSAAWLSAACGSREWLCLAVALAVSAGGDATLRNGVPYLFNAALPHSSNPYPWRLYTDRLTQAYWFSRAAGALLAGYLADRAAAVEVHPESDALRRHALATSGITHRAAPGTSPGSLAALRAALLPDSDGQSSTARPSAARKANARRAALLAAAVFSMALGQLMLLSVLMTPAGSSLSNTDALNEARSWSIIIGGVLIAAANGAALTLMPTLLVALYLEDPEAEGGAPSPLGEARTAFGALYGLMSIAPALGQLALFNGLTVAEFEANKGALWCSGEAGCYTTTMAVELALSVLATLAALELARCAVGRHIPALLRTAATSGAADRAVM